MRVFWKPVIMHSATGSRIVANPLGLGPSIEDSKTLEEIKAMTGKPISLELAANIYSEDIEEAGDIDTRLMMKIMQVGIAKWIGQQGFKIELTGNEFYRIP